MVKRCLLILMVIGFFITSSSINAQKAKHTFKFSATEFLLDDEPFQIISGEMQPARIAKDCWRQRIQMAKAMGCNTISASIFWN
ncbi:MAG: beta-galactosidase, partial [Bacteroidota bacterium]|nr:beta-galactosidase [Bacteroidota bacterium]